MRNLNYFALMGAALLTGAVAFTSCSSDDEVAGDGGTGATGEVVKTQFAINIPYGNGSTRMSDETVQDNKPFRGMQNIYLIPLTAAGSESSAFTNVIPLKTFSDFDGSSSNYKLYNDVNVPVGTTNFLFYGIGGTTIPSNATGKFTNGILSSTLPSTASTADVKFALEQILTGSDFEAPQSTLLGVLNGIANVTDWSAQTADTPLNDLYDAYITLKGGSAHSILLALQDLYNAVNTIATASGDSPEKTIALAIQTEIAKSFTVSADAPYTLTWNVSGVDANYPTNLNVPEGTAQLTWSDGTGFAYVNANAVVGTGINVVNVYNLCYPASLAYFVNTPLKATTETNVTWPNGAENWIAENAFSGWGNTVQATTRTIALQNNIQYGVANLKTTVKCKTTTLEDNAAEVAGLPSNQSIIVPSAGFPVTGLLVGGQPSAASWDMTPAGSVLFDRTVYDNALTDIYAKYNTPSSANYTLLLDNTDETPKAVNIAIELTNNTGTDFYGVDGIIANGAKFYLVARLDPAGTTGVTKPGGVTDVFQQDYTTTANLTITSLENAYVTIPDLRASELTLGLSVDLTWQAGMSFDVEIGGN